MYLKNFHEYENVKKITFGYYREGLFKLKKRWYADVELELHDGIHEVRWSLDNIEVIKDKK